MSALTFITCGSVDDGKSTLIGRLLLDSKAILADQLAAASAHGRLNGTTDAPDLAAFTDGLQAEREQGITIDVAWRYFSTPTRKFIIGDTPGHEQYTRNMVTAASHADAAIVMIDATKLDWQNTHLTLLPQTRRHTLLLQLLKIDAIAFAINKLDAVASPAQAFANIQRAVRTFTKAAGIGASAVLPVSALAGYNVVTRNPNWAGYDGPCLLEWLESIKTLSPETQGAHADATIPTHFSVQWVETDANPSDTGSRHSRRTYWGRLASGRLKVGDGLRVSESGQVAVVAALYDTVRQPIEGDKAQPGRSYGVRLDRELDVSRGDWLRAPEASVAVSQITAAVAWLDTVPLVVGATYWALHGNRWTKAKVTAIHHQINIETLATQPAEQLNANDIGRISLLFQSPLPIHGYADNPVLGSLILVDTSTHATAGAVMADTVP